MLKTHIFNLITVINTRAAGGNTLISIEGLEGSDQLNDSDDILDRYFGNDLLDSRSGNDRLGGGDGDDILTGGKGADPFLLNITEADVDSITDSSHYQGDPIHLCNTFRAVAHYTTALAPVSLTSNV